MRITKSQLKQIIKEELKPLQEDRAEHIEGLAKKIKKLRTEKEETTDDARYREIETCLEILEVQYDDLKKGRPLSIRGSPGLKCTPRKGPDQTPKKHKRTPWQGTIYRGVGESQLKQIVKEELEAFLSEECERSAKGNITQKSREKHATVGKDKFPICDKKSAESAIKLRGHASDADQERIINKAAKYAPAAAKKAREVEKKEQE